MKELIRIIFGNKPKHRSVYSFFTEASSEERKKVVGAAVRAANDEQKNLVKKYERMFSR
ncbi:MAG TPA: hypothetical protein VF974_00365 [Patescibacteria group bacterium]